MRQLEKLNTHWIFMILKIVSIFRYDKDIIVLCLKLESFFRNKYFKMNMDEIICRLEFAFENPESQKGFGESIKQN